MSTDTSTLNLTTAELAYLKSLSPSDCRSVLEKMKERTASPSIRAKGQKKWDKDRINEYQKEQYLKTRDIGPIPMHTIDWDRRNACKYDFKRDCLTYNSEKFYLSWSPTHQLIASAIERAVLGQSMEAIACPRGTGKSVLCELGVDWAIRHGHRRYAALICAEGDKYEDAIAGFRTRWESNELYLQDFPEIIFPIRCLRGAIQAVRGQLCEGQATRMEWGAKKLVTATNRESVELGNGGSIIGGGGILKAVRGAKHEVPGGQVLRPDFALVDDPQTRESASSVSQSLKRLRIISSDVMRMAGPGRPMSAVMACTVIEKHDMVDKVLSPAHPEWFSIRVPFLQSEPKNMDLWNEYGEALRQCWAEERPIDDAMRIYAEKRYGLGWERWAPRPEFHEGATVYWEDRIDAPYITALQTTMSARIKDPESWAAEDQNDPVDPHKPENVVYCDKDEILAKTSVWEQFEVPDEATELCVHIDVQLDVLIYSVLASSPGFKVHCCDYGTWPPQQRAYWTKNSLVAKLSDYESSSANAAWLNGFKQLTMDLMARNWHRKDGSPVHITRGLIDGATGAGSKEIVYQFCRDHGQGIWLPSVGKGIKASGTQLNEGKKPQPRVKLGVHWRRAHDAQRRTDWIIFDANFWKTEVHKALRTAEGNDGCLTLFRGKHHLLADHLTSEYPKLMQESGRPGSEAVEWFAKPNADNDYLDNFANALVAISERGGELPGTEGRSKPRRKKITQADIDRALL